MALITDNSTLEEIEDAVVDEILVLAGADDYIDEDTAHEMVRPLLLHPEKFAELLISAKQENI